VSGASSANARRVLTNFTFSSRRVLTTNHVYSDASVLICQLFFIFNCAMALSPLFRAKDELLDIPLSPTQRSLLGLDPAATPPATPGTTFVTPPKYRLSTSRNNSPASRQGSPLSASANASYSERRPSIGTPFSPVSSPLLYKAISNGGNTNRESFQRQSFGSSSQIQGFGSPSPLARSNSFGESTFSLGSFGGSLGPGTPSPLAGKRTSVGMPNKWLYERARRLSASGGAM
jgi:nucleoporin POM34